MDTTRTTDNLVPGTVTITMGDRRFALKLVRDDTTYRYAIEEAGPGVRRDSDIRTPWRATRTRALVAATKRIAWAMAEQRRTT